LIDDVIGTVIICVLKSVLGFLRCHELGIFFVNDIFVLTG